MWTSNGGAAGRLRLRPMRHVIRMTSMSLKGMFGSRLKRLTDAWVVLGVLLVMACPVAGQINDPSVAPENIDKLPAKQPIVEYALGGAFLLAALAIGFKPSPRVAREKKAK